jgi:hypothetical protein
MAELTQFDLGSAARIARVVRSVEQTPQPGKPLSFAPVMDAPSGKVFRVATFTAAWGKNERRTVTLYNQTSTPNTVSALNLLFDLTGPATAGGSTTKVCIVGKEGKDWYFVNAETPSCDNGSYRAEEISPSASSLSEANDLGEGDGPQVLVNDNGCVKWMRLKKFYAVARDDTPLDVIEPDNGGVKWNVKTVFAFPDAAGNDGPDSIECSLLGRSVIGGEVDIGDFGSGQVRVSDSPDGCGHIVNVDIQQSTESCPEE